MEESTRKYQEDVLEKFQDVLDIQGDHGNWNVDPYMHGMYNGMALMKAIVENIDNKEPDYRDAPDHWLQEDIEAARLGRLHNKHPALKHAYEEYIILRNLIEEQ